MTPNDKITVKAAALSALLHETAPLAGQQVFSIIADTERALKRAARRAEQTEGFERVEFAQHGGPTIEFNGRLLAENSFEAKGHIPTRVAFEIWETEAGALIAASISTPLDGQGTELVEVTVAEPRGDTFTLGDSRPMSSPDDAQAMHFAIMDHFGWRDGARGMAKKLGWDLKVEIL
ncbi:hypothetical protein [Novosphingobium sp.]|uniref:hypothetical protein n=1 Tax=Novosphingobium sp. TaxID=1874826 RepID=UPI00286E9B47|nr:hypothetical protein [Novosphingobium sp.]